jgi:hypothetical protein
MSVTFNTLDAGWSKMAEGAGFEPAVLFKHDSLANRPFKPGSGILPLVWKSGFGPLTP